MPKSLLRQAKAMLRPLRARLHSVQAYAAQLLVPEVSVVIPVYNGASTIERTVRSVLGQGLSRVEVIVVDDCSTDGTRETVRSLSRKDPRVHLVVSPMNGGPGQARNIGVNLARGRYLAFVDADDQVLANAYRRMLRVIRDTGSDFISGGYQRSGSGSPYRPDITSRVHAQTRLKTNIVDHPSVLEEPVLWNKIYRTDFFRGTVGAIPEDRNYEDQEPALRAAMLAGAFDIVDFDVYSWSLPAGRNTRSQTKRTLADLESRKLVVESLLAQSKRLPRQARTVLISTVLGRDLGMYLSEVPYTSDEYWEVLHNLTRKTWDAADRETVMSVPVVARVLSYVGAYGTRHDVETLDGAISEFGTHAHWTQMSGGGWKTTLPYLNELEIEIPEWLLVAGVNDWTVRARVWDAHGGDDGHLKLSGYAFISGLDQRDQSELTLDLLDPEGERIWSTTLKNLSSDWVDVEANDPWTSYADSAFKVIVPITPNQWESSTLTVSGAIGDQNLSVRLDQPHTDSRLHDTLLNSVTLRKNTVHFEGLGLHGNDPELALISSSAHQALPLDRHDPRSGAWSCHFDLADPSIPTMGLFLKHKQDGQWRDVSVGRNVVSGPPLRLVGEARAVAISRVNGSKTGVTLSAPLTNTERSRFGRQRLSMSIPAALQSAVVYDSFAGKVPNDNPLAVFEQVQDGSLPVELSSLLPSIGPDTPSYWSLNDGTIQPPQGTEPIYVGSTKWFEVIRSAKLLVTNNHLPVYFQKAPGQFWLQTWHGTPIKKLLLDAPRDTTSVLYRRTMAKQVPTWDLLLAQSDDAAKNLVSSTGYTGKVLVIEQPRNARLFEPGLRESTRSRLGIGDHEKVILYAPTWRKSDVGSTGRPSYLLDTEWLAERTGCKVLVRTHHMTNAPQTNSSNVLDVSKEPRVEDLMVASDILISDYSSIIIDYALLGRPTAIHAPDAVAYALERGFYG